jgi:hypothetical protein
MNSLLKNRAKTASRSPTLTVMASVIVLWMFTSCKQDDADRAPRNAGEKTTAATSSSESATDSPQQLITKLAAIDLTHGALTTGQAAAGKQTLKLLVAHGQAAIPAIREFIGRNQDVVFDAPGSAELADAPSLRLALLGALEEIGGSQAVVVAQQSFQAAADPAELATLAKFLEHAEPGKHRGEFVSAAKETLAQAASGNWDGRDVAPLFEMLRAFGGPAELAELERYANTWFDYTPITLAQWPDGAGVPLLIKLAQNANGSITLGREMYQRMLAEVAAGFPAAADELVAQVRGNKIDMAAWPAMGQALAGHTLHFVKSYFSPPSPLLGRPGTRSYHVAVGNQSYLEAAPADDASAKSVGDRIRLIDRLFEATPGPAALDALEGARISLSARLPRAK